MLDLPKKKLIRFRQQIRNPGDSLFVVILEPWADRFELKSEETIDIEFVGPETGQPEVLPYPGELAIYGWDGSEVVVLKDGRLAMRQPTVNEIVRQELEIAERCVRRTETRWPTEGIEIVGQKFQFYSEMSFESQEFACHLTSQLVCELSATLERSDGIGGLDLHDHAILRFGALGRGRGHGLFEHRLYFLLIKGPFGSPNGNIHRGRNLRFPFFYLLCHGTIWLVGAGVDRNPPPLILNYLLFRDIHCQIEASQFNSVRLHFDRQAVVDFRYCFLTAVLVAADHQRDFGQGLDPAARCA
jgi:hypothetical protein